MDPRQLETAFQTQSEIRALLDAHGGHPKKRFGQCFLIDRNLMHKLLLSADLQSTDCVLEVGTGTGSLTGLVAATGANVVTVEVDPDVLEIAQERLSDCERITFLLVDALEGKRSVSPSLVDALMQAHVASGGKLKLVANLPYDIATPLVMNLLLSNLPFERMCFTVQTEVADRFLAKPCTKDYGPVSIVTQLLAVGHRICKLPARAFWPAPKVESSMVRLDVRPREESQANDTAGFAEFVHLFFNYRRKTVAHTARHLSIADKVLPALDQLGIAHNVRPEEMGVAEWAALFSLSR
ncbi:MAG: ribosomal RNA small subunit methyltransferase A [Phycisphaerae bacterium]|nr:ribosomal RNA small subunit methyltransferase A [Phycisphaerae bacterium]